MLVHYIKYRSSWSRRIFSVLNSCPSNPCSLWSYANWQAMFMADAMRALKNGQEFNLTAYHRKGLQRKVADWNDILASKKGRRQAFLVARNRLDRFAADVGLDPSDFIDPNDQFLSHELSQGVYFQFKCM